MPEIIKVNVADLKQSPNNTRTHSKDQVKQIAASIKEFGWTNPVLIDSNNMIIAGHGRIMAAKQLGIKQVPAIDLSHLNEDQRRAYIIADNQTALNAGWDDELLAIEIEALKNNNFDIDLLAFSDDELDEIKKSADLSEELKEKIMDLSPIKYTRILISIRTDSAQDINQPIKAIIDAGAEVDYGGN